jgi:hypothetical protein
MAARWIDADPDRMLAGALRLAGLADELAAVAVRCRAVPMDGSAGLPGRQDELVAGIGRRVIELAVVAARLRREADALAECDRAAAAGLDAVDRARG